MSRAIIIGALVLALSIRGSRAEGSDAEAKPAETTTENTAKNHRADPNYQFQPDDVVEVTVFREPDLTTQGMVRQDGTFDMKLLGAVKVGECTADQVAQAIRAALARDYLVDPRVSVGIIEYARHKVNVLGEVRSPGVYLCPGHGPMLLSDALALAGGLLSTGDAAHVSIQRTAAGKPVTLDVCETASPDFQLKPDDAVDVPLLPRRHFTVLGQVARPGTYDFTQGHRLYLTDAIALAGGFTRLANPSHVLLKRTQDGKERVEAVNAQAMEYSPKTQRLEMQNEDTITVPESLF